MAWMTVSLMMTKMMMAMTQPIQNHLKMRTHGKMILQIRNRISIEAHNIRVFTVVSKPLDSSSYRMVGPGNRALRKPLRKPFKMPDVQNFSSNYDVRKPHQSSSDVPQRHQSSRHHDGLPPQTSSGHKLHPQDSNDRHGGPHYKKPVSKHGPQPQNSVSIHGVPQPYMSINKSFNTNDIPHQLGGHKGQASIRLQDKNRQFHDTLQAHSFNTNHARWVPQTESEVNSPQMEEDGHEVDSPQVDSDTSDSQQDENIDYSPSHGTFDTRTQSRTLGETKKRRLNKGKFIFEVDEYDKRIVGDDSQRFITKGGCVMRKFAKFDGTTWRNQDDMLKIDIINKCTVS
uniref:uncharacterized protein LOC122596497 isoform X2 n=1 Tax=Erigeron canadensis TaxID=72917 RepID=UPI001CB8E934|nr:uncharacterized protein LOC122596497 isoform X2 [Erigeron canadensis]